MSEHRALINYDDRPGFPQALRAQGVYIWDADGNRCLDGCSGALVANIGHGVREVTRAMAAQAGELDYVYRYHYSSPPAEDLAARYCALTTQPMGRVFFVNSGSEASEAAVRLARARHLAVGEPGRHRIISRWQSYHGITMGALSWSGFVARRQDFAPYLKDFDHIPPAYCHRCWFGARPESCDLECARALETAILSHGPETVAAFIAEPVVGSALAAAVPPPGYFPLIREICERYGVLFIAEEVMSGAGRTGGRFFASDHFNARPDIIVFGKGVGGGYYPLAGALISKDVAEAIDSGGQGFGAGQSYSGHPTGMAAGAAVLDYFEAHDLLTRSAEMGDYLGRTLTGRLTGHPLVDDIRGKGLMWGLEFSPEPGRKDEAGPTFDPGLQVFARVYTAARDLGLLVLPSSGCDRGSAGDGALIGPPLTINQRETDELVDVLEAALNRVVDEMG